ncbi:mediator of RNA polymerase II transcription subunit 20-like [Actinia tenebrosa]|uniref:Mediator of RNA polymerase II transcription subunit 20 n=1 Tax=Actinia tenebrosa TaxID=6105 RepID=A0A6P8IVU6_ACTTE|nr:mediator of RNA polymerase II transcription subunit 20-like [Actinia tenebrosa]
MGVTRVFPWEIAEGKSGQQTVEMLQKRAELLGATKTGNWCVDCDTYMSSSNVSSSSSKYIHLVHNTEFPYTSFAVLESGTCLVASTGFDSLMIRIKAFYVQRKASKIEVKGTRYEHGDFILKIGQVLIGPSVKGVVIELEYLPCQDVDQCWSLIIEWAASFLGSSFSAPSIPKTSNKETGLFRPSDIILQYIDLFNSYRKVQSGP